MLVKRNLIFFFIFFKISISFCQIQFTGQLFDKNTNAPIQNANIILKKLNSETIISFTFSDKNGSFVINSMTNLDSVVLNVRNMGYAPIILKLLNKSKKFNLLLEQAFIELKEIKVKQEPIRKYGDTLSYNVGEFKDKNDRVLADVLKRLPGIEVEASGRILYQGEPINKYYIEGLDLLNGRYKLANDNLNINAVRSVEVLENHQPIRMLDSTVFSEKAAINIKLKKAITNSGQMSLGAGLSPFLWDANFTPMLFSKKLQIIGTFQANNIGKNSASQLMQLTPGTVFSDLVSGKSNMLGIQQLANPAFKESRWLDNNVKIGSINILRKVKKGLELRLIQDFASDIQYQEGATNTTFFDSAKENIVLTEIKSNRLGFNSSKTDLTLQKNTKSKYLKNTVKINAYWDSQQGNITRNIGNLMQKTTLPMFSASNNYQDFFKIKNNILALNSKAGYEKSRQTLWVDPSVFLALFDARTTKETARQNVFNSKLYTENSVQFIKKIKKITLENSLGFSLNKENLSSDLTLQNQQELRPLGQEFRNNLDWIEQKYYLETISRLNVSNWKIALTTPLSYISFLAKDQETKKEQSLHRMIFEPRLSINKEIKNFWTLYANASKTNSFGDIRQMYFGYILNNYRDVKRFNAPILQNVTYSGNVGLNYANPITNWFGSLSYTKSKTISNLTYSSMLNTNGSIEQNAIEANNENNSQNTNARIGKYIRTIKTTFTLKTNIFLQNGIQIINQRETLVSSKGIRPIFDISSNLSTWLSLSYNYGYSSFQNKVGRETRPKVEQQNHFLNLNFNTKNQLLFGIYNEAYINNFNNQRNFFTDLFFRKTIGKRKVDLEANFTNIFNSNVLLTVSSGTFSYIETSYTLRPSQGVFKVRFSY